LNHPNPISSQTGGRPIPGYSLNLKGKKVPDKRIKEYLMILIEGEESIYGYRKLTRCLRQKYHLVINKKKVYRLCKELDILMPQREKKNKVPRQLAKNRLVTAPNQLWQLDIKYGYVTGSNRFFYLASAIDVFDRSIVCHYRGKTCEAKDIVQVLKQGLLKRGIYSESDSRLIIRTDNGPQFISNAFHEFCNTNHVEHERIPPKTPNMNAYIESFHSVLERECYRRNEFRSFEEAFKEVDRYISFYNKKRLHGSLDDLSPQEFAKRYAKGEIKQIEIAV
jgi:putative transposase